MMVSIYAKILISIMCFCYCCLFQLDNGKKASLCDHFNSWWWLFSVGNNIPRWIKYCHYHNYLERSCFNAILCRINGEAKKAKLWHLKFVCVRIIIIIIVCERERNGIKIKCNKSHRRVSDDSEKVLWLLNYKLWIKFISRTTKFVCLL